MLNFLLISTASQMLLINCEDKFLALSDSIVLGAPCMQINSWYMQSAIAEVAIVFNGEKITYLVRRHCMESTHTFPLFEDGYIPDRSIATCVMGLDPLANWVNFMMLPLVAEPFLYSAQVVQLRIQDSTSDLQFIQ